MTPEYEIGERLYWFDAITCDPETEPGKDAPERYATVTDVEEDGTVHFEFDDGVVDWADAVNIPDFMERVTWDTTMS